MSQKRLVIIITFHNEFFVGGICQCLELQSLAGGLSLLCICCMVDSYRSANQANSAFHPSGVGK